MKNEELIEFYDNYMYLSFFERTKKIYELTYNLDLFLLKTLKEDFARHYLNKALKLAKDYQNGIYNDPEDINPHHTHTSLFVYFREKGFSNIDLLNITLDGIISDTEYKLVEFIFDGMADFLYDIDDLIRYKQNGNIIKVDEHELIDYSEENNVSKIIFLEKLGIIDELRKKAPFNTSINSLASILSAITGSKSTTIQPMLNAMLTKDNYEKNNPLRSEKTVKIVLNKLANIGYTVNKNISD
jgi:hypothetical protein